MGFFDSIDVKNGVDDMFDYNRDGKLDLAEQLMENDFWQEKLRKEREAFNPTPEPEEQEPEYDFDAEYERGVEEFREKLMKSMRTGEPFKWV